MKSLEIFIYSLIQGVTEFLPISSSAHLYAVENLFDWEIEGLTIALAAHLGTLLAVIFFEKNFLVKSFYSIFKNKERNEFLLIIVCVLPVLLVSFLIIIFFKDNYKFGIITIAISSIIGALLMDFSDTKKIKTRKKDQLSLKDAIFIGFFQTLALIPGMSRSGTIITGARFLGYTRLFSVKISLLTSIPVISLASCYGLFEIFVSNQKIYFDFIYITFFTFICAFFSIKFIIRWIKYFSFRVFSIYRILFGIFLIISVYI